MIFNSFYKATFIVDISPYYNNLTNYFHPLHVHRLKSVASLKKWQMLNCINLVDFKILKCDNKAITVFLHLNVCTDL